MLIIFHAGSGSWFWCQRDTLAAMKLLNDPYTRTAASVKETYAYEIYIYHRKTAYNMLCEPMQHNFIYLNCYFVQTVTLLQIKFDLM